MAKSQLHGGKKRTSSSVIVEQPYKPDKPRVSFLGERRSSRLHQDYGPSTPAPVLENGDLLPGGFSRVPVAANGFCLVDSILSFLGLPHTLDDNLRWIRFAVKFYYANSVVFINVTAGDDCAMTIEVSKVYIYITLSHTYYIYLNCSKMLWRPC